MTIVFNVWYSVKNVLRFFSSPYLFCLAGYISCTPFTVPFASCAELNLDSWVADFDGHFLACVMS